MVLQADWYGSPSGSPILVSPQTMLLYLPGQNEAVHFPSLVHMVEIPPKALPLGPVFLDPT